ncbi:MAG: flagellar basal body P-ring protein FlgI [Clostridia bacterium]|nr:flagellar basal body P-ring protein FlgI [Clostridia bacterium]
MRTWRVFAGLILVCLVFGASVGAAGLEEPAVSASTGAVPTGAVPAETAPTGVMPAASPVSGVTVRVKDITRVYGVRGNQLIGYGLVVGLRGTGDSKSTPFTSRSLANMLEKFKITVDPLEVKSKNVAAVMVTATLHPFAKPGDLIDVSASSVGDAKNLLGGVLLMTELSGADGQVYAVAQGPINAGADLLPTVGRISGGATVEGYVEMQMITSDGLLLLSLINPDYATASRIAKAVCDRFGENVGAALDAGTVRVSVPEPLRDIPTPFVAEVGALEVSPDAPAKVVFNSRTGVVVIGGNVRVSPAAVSYNGFSVKVGEESDLGAGGVLGGSTVMLEAGSTIQALITALNSVGARPKDIMSIMETLRASGALQAELQVI